MSFPRYLPFASEWISFGLFFLAILVMIGISELARNRLSWSIENSRKLVHVIVGLMISISPFLFSSPLPPAILAIIFIILNLAALRSNKLQGMHATARTTYGTVYFPIAFLILILLYWDKPPILIAGTLLMTLADTAASLMGNWVDKPRYYQIWKDRKSLEGSVIMYLTALVILLGLLIFTNQFLVLRLSRGQMIGGAGFVALIAMLAESTSAHGSDNFSVPVLSALVLDLYLENIAAGNNPAFLIWTGFSLIMFLMAIRARALSASGGVAAFLIGLIIFGTGGLPWIMPLIVFFLLSSILSKIRKRAAAGDPDWNNFQKGSRRDILQVLANGGVATIIALINHHYPVSGLYPVYLSAIAAANADTWATEIGFFSRRRPRHIVSWQRIPRGASGGISIIGTAGTIAGAATIALTGWLFGSSAEVAGIIILAGLAGSLIDSLIGGTIQARFTCPSCGKSTENKIHCGVATNFHSGISWIDNDLVNLLCTMSGAGVMLVTIQFLT